VQGDGISSNQHVLDAVFIKRFDDSLDEHYMVYTSIYLNKQEASW
jgi:hypothetical protein